MERAGLARIDDDRCAHLRWKGMFIPAEWDPVQVAALQRPFVLVPQNANPSRAGRANGRRLRMPRRPQLLPRAVIKPKKARRGPPAGASRKQPNP